jgi:hypothetical protein
MRINYYVSITEPPLTATMDCGMLKSLRLLRDEQKDLDLKRTIVVSCSSHSNAEAHDLNVVALTAVCSPQCLPTGSFVGVFNGGRNATR